MNYEKIQEFIKECQKEQEKFEELYEAHFLKGTIKLSYDEFHKVLSCKDLLKLIILYLTFLSMSYYL